MKTISFLLRESFKFVFRACVNFLCSLKIFGRLRCSMNFFVQFSWLSLRVSAKRPVFSRLLPTNLFIFCDKNRISKIRFAPNSVLFFSVSCVSEILYFVHWRFLIFKTNIMLSLHNSNALRQKLRKFSHIQQNPFPTVIKQNPEFRDSEE